ncbi:chymotrypsin-like protease CTRL-1 isoform X1 [Papio anubis]|uniref:chymotrypsin-like protease CTRL-1 isoform X1 n=1 Tax=Papio anubis TaxID=9555 RepID=UPI0012AD9E17|nr:chymotrypsin-like protease CTRL-1 isoform X1 [Papio anubis]
MQYQAPGPGRCPCRTAAASTFAVVLSSASLGWSLLPTAMSGEHLHSTCPAPRLFLPPPLAVPLSLWPPCSCLTPPLCSPGRHFVVLGEHDLSSNAEPLQVLSISQAITHPSWNPTTMNNDVTLLKLASPAQYTTRISPVCLASSNEALTEGLTCVTTGWGRLSGVGNVTPARLQQVALPLVTVNQCRQYWGSDITDSMICAGGAGASSCQGDSGGPLVCQKGNTWVLIGIVSWGTKNCNVRAPAVYTRVSKFSAWINQVIAYN